MREDWDARAKENARKYVASLSYRTEEEFDKSARICASMLLRPILGMINQSMIALDIGCGIGRLEKVLSPYFRVIYGVDVSPKMIEIAKQRLMRLRNVRLCVNNGLDLSLFQDSSFDLVFSYLTFQHMPRWVAYGYFREAYRVLRPNGIFRIPSVEQGTFDC